MNGGQVCGNRGVRSGYEHHTPLYVPLSEVAAELDGGVPDLLSIAAVLAVRRGCAVSPLQLSELFGKGLLAIFFDGLDEIVSVETRSRVMSAVRELVEQGHHVGNRFVLTSRPAAVHKAELPKGLEILRMKGLTDAEMRSLAERILAARISETRGNVRLDVQQLSASDHSTVDQILADCRTTPGIDRIARNPLFLTLLVMIYANSGAASARRHRVYQQAVTTLVSIRARQAGQRGLSESDLRKRLGAVALSVFRDRRGALPTLSTVIEVVGSVIELERGARPPSSEVEKYLQDVAEATGLIVFHRDDVTTDPPVTFMHHSFLEYYAAVGLASTDYLVELPTLARIPRWRDIITLMSGIVGDSGDLSPLVDTILGVQDTVDAITFESSLLALDCALETDIPPERVLRALIGRVEASIASGSLRYDSDLREEVGIRLGRLISGSGSPLLESMLVQGLSAGDDEICATYIDLLSHSASQSDLGPTALASFDAACTRSATVVRAAACRAAGRSVALRSDAAVSAVGEAIRGSAELRLAALEAIAEAPSLGTALVYELARGLDDSSPKLAELTARALLKVGLPLEASNPERVLLLAKALRRVAESAPVELAAEISLSYSRRDIEPLLEATEKSLRLLGVRLLAWVTDDDRYVHDKLMSIVQSSEREESVAALGSLRIARAAQKLLSVPDGYVVRRLLLPEHPRDIRLASARVLAVLFPHDADIVRELVEYCRSVRNTDYYEPAVLILSWLASEHEIVQAFLLDEAERITELGGSLSPARARDMSALLGTLSELDVDAPSRLVSRLIGIYEDFKYDPQLRRKALFAVMATANVERAVLYLKGLLSTAPGRLAGAVLIASAQFAARCRKRLAYVRAVYPHLNEFQESLGHYYERAMGAIGSDGDVTVPATRAALSDIRYMFNSYREFAQRRDSQTELPMS